MPWLRLALVGVLGVVLGMAALGRPAWPLGLAAAGGLAELPLGPVGVLAASLGAFLGRADGAAFASLLCLGLLPLAVSEGFWPRLRRGVGGPVLAAALAAPVALALPGGYPRFLLIPLTAAGALTISLAWRSLHAQDALQRRVGAGVLALAAVAALPASGVGAPLLLSVALVYVALRARLGAAVLSLALGALLAVTGAAPAAAGLCLALGGALGVGLRSYGSFWAWVGLSLATAAAVHVLPLPAGESLVGDLLVLLAVGQAVPERAFTMLRHSLSPPVAAPSPPPDRLQAALGQFEGLIRALGSEVVASTTEEADVARFLGSVREHVCTGCRFEHVCWDQGFYRTYTGVRELMLRPGSGPTGAGDLPPELRQRCPRPDQVATAVVLAGERLRQEAGVRRVLQAERTLARDVLLGVRQMLGWALASPAEAGPVRLHFRLGAAQVAKGRSALSGDSYLMRELDDGRLLIALSDGMGTGYRAAEQSAGALECLEGLVGTGMDPLLAVRSTNAVRRALGGDSYATLDVALVDLASGEVSSLKIGAPETYLWRSGEVQILRGEALPLGVLPEADATVQRLDLKAGDRLVLVSDGVLDALPGERGSWLEGILGALGGRDPQYLAELILDAATSRQPSPRDDVTVLVAGFQAARGDPEVRPWRRRTQEGIAMAAQGKTAGRRGRR